MDTMVVSDDEESSVSGEEEATDSPPGLTERKGKKLAQKAYLNSLFDAGLRSASKSQRPFLEKAAADTGLTISQVVVSQ